MPGQLRSESGFSLAEMIIATGLLLVVSSVVTSALLQMTKQQQTIWNRSEMHSGVRGATELLQQEVGQAGRVALPATVTLGTAVAGLVSPATCNPGTPLTNAVTVPVTSVSGMFASAGPPAAYESLVVLDGNTQETIKLAATRTTPPAITACFANAHAAGVVIAPMGAFATGVVPPTGVLNGSTANKLKLYGDINADGNMEYIEYYCDNGDPGTAGSFNLYRNSMAFDAASKPALTNAMILLSNIHSNPPDASGNARPCFQYQTQTLTVQGTPFTFVLDVAVTLTARTAQVDPVTHQYQTETKALLNVSPRNIFNAWSLASIGYIDHIQSTPATVTALQP